MKIRITQCKDPFLWYSKYVGFIFVVCEILPCKQWVMGEWCDALTAKVRTPDNTINFVHAGDYRFITKPGVIK